MFLSPMEVSTRYCKLWFPIFLNIIIMICALVVLELDLHSPFVQSDFHGLSEHNGISLCLNHEKTGTHTHIHTHTRSLFLSLSPDVCLYVCAIERVRVILSLDVCVWVTEKGGSLSASWNFRHHNVEPLCSLRHEGLGYYYMHIVVLKALMLFSF
jgi:hypothetical protein